MSDHYLKGHTQRPAEKPSIKGSWLHHAASLISLQDLCVSDLQRKLQTE